MSNELAFADARRQARASLLGTWLDGGTVSLYTGTRPATPDTAITDQVLLAAFQLADPAGVATDGVWVGELSDPALILDTGTPTWARFRDDASGTVCDADVGATGSGAAVEVENTSFVEGAYASITSMTITEG